MTSANEANEANEAMNEGMNRAGFSLPKGNQPTAADIESIHQTAYDEGLEEGKKEGYTVGLNKGLSEGKAKIEAEKAKLSQMIRALMKPIAEEESKIKVALHEIIASLTMEIIQREMKLDKSILLNIIQEAVEALDVGEKAITLSVSDSDHKMITELAKQLPDFNDSWKIKKHPRLTEGAILVGSGNSKVELSILTIAKEALNQFYQEIADSFHSSN